MLTMKKFEVRARHSGVKVKGATEKPGRKFVVEAHSALEAVTKIRNADEKFRDSVLRATRLS